MTDLRVRMLEELQRRNFSETTIKTYLRVVEDFAQYFGKRPDRLNQHDIRKYQVHVARAEAHSQDGSVAHSRLAILLREDTAPSVPARGSAVSEKPETTPLGFEPGRSCAPDRLGKQPAG